MCRKLAQCREKSSWCDVSIYRLRTYHVLLSGELNASTKSPDNKIMTEYFCMFAHSLIRAIYNIESTHFHIVIYSNPNIQWEHSNSIAFEWDKQQGIQ